MITLTGKPISTNSLYRYRCQGNFPRMYMTAKGKDLKEQYFYEAKSQWKKKPLEGDVTVNVILYFGDKRKHDIDNYNKLVLDSLTGIVYFDDEQIQELNVIKQYDKENPRIEITIL